MSTHGWRNTIRSFPPAPTCKQPRANNSLASAPGPSAVAPEAPIFLFFSQSQPADGESPPEIPPGAPAGLSDVQSPRLSLNIYSLSGYDRRGKAISRCFLPRSPAQGVWVFQRSAVRSVWLAVGLSAREKSCLQTLIFIPKNRKKALKNSIEHILVNI